MNSDEEEFFSSLKKKKRRISERSDEVVSSEDDALCEQQTPETSCAKRSTHSRSSERLRNKKKFVMPKKDVIWRDIQSTEKTKLRTPSKCVNDFTRITNRYNADRFDTFEDDNYESDDLDEFINDEEESDESEETPHPRRIKGYRRRLLPRTSDSDSEDNTSCQPLDHDHDSATDDDSSERVVNCVNDGEGSRSNSPLSGVKLKKCKFKSNVIESSDSETYSEEKNRIENEHELPLEKGSEKCTEDASCSIIKTKEEEQFSLEVKAVNQTDVGGEEVITISDDELFSYCASLESTQATVTTSSESSESKSSTGSESAQSDSESQSEEELEKHDRAYRQRQEKLKKFEEFNKIRRNRKLSK